MARSCALLSTLFSNLRAEDILIDPRKSAPSLNISSGWSIRSTRGSHDTQRNSTCLKSRRHNETSNANHLTATFPAPGSPEAFAIEIGNTNCPGERRVVLGKATNHPFPPLPFLFSILRSTLASHDPI